MKKKIKYVNKFISLGLAISFALTSFNSVKVYADEYDASNYDVYLENEIPHEDASVDFEDFEVNPAINVTIPKSTRTIAPTLNLSEYVIDAPVEKETVVLTKYLPNTYLNNVLTRRGDYMARVIIPYEIKTGETITLQQTGGSGQYSLSVGFHSGLMATEIDKTLNKNGDLLSITALSDSTIFIRVPRAEFQDITVEYSITKATSIPIFEQGVSDEATFFAEWDTLQTKFALLTNDVIILQVPSVNKEFLRNIKAYKDFDDINAVLQYYVDMIAFFDMSYGLDGVEAHNFNPNQRYLAVPELRDGTGLAGTYISSIVRTYGVNNGLKAMLVDGWASKHEVAHGYQGDMMDFDTSVREIWNNIPTHYFSMESPGNRTTYRDNYIKNDQPKGQLSMYNRYLAVQEKGGPGKYSLEFFREIFDVVGLEVFAKFNQDYRELGITKSHMDLSNTNRFAEYFSKHAEVDLIPYFLSQGFIIDESVLAANYELPNIFYLTELTSNQEIIDYILSEYSLATKYSLVDTSIFSTDENLKNIRGSAIVNIDIDNFDELEGKQVMLKNGDYEYFARIIDGKAIFENIPVGEYNVGMPLTNSGLCKNSAEKYITVSDGKVTEINTEYSIMKDNILNIEYIFNIKNDANYTPFYADLTYVSDNNYNLKLGTLADRYNPNQSTNDLYGYFKVFDENGEEIRNYEFYNLTPSIAGIENITVKKGYTFEMYRTNMPQRKYYKNIALSKEYYDKNAELMKFEITDNGLQYINGSDISEEITVAYLDANYNNFSKRSQYNMGEKFVYLNNAISKLSPESQAVYAEKFKEITRTHNPTVSVLNETIETVVGTEPNYLENLIANDYEDGQIKSIVIDDSNVDVQNVGTYIVNVTIEDSDHNYMDTQMFVKVIEKVNIDENTDKTEEIDEDKSEDEIIEETDEDKSEDETIEEPNEDKSESEAIEDEKTDETTDKTYEDKAESETSEEDNEISEEETESEDETQTESSKETSEANEKDSSSEVANEKPIEIIVDNKQIPPFTNEVIDSTELFDFSGNFNEALNKNKLVPFYINESTEKKIVKFSSVIDNEVVFIKDEEDRDYNFEEVNDKVYVDIDNSWAKGNIEFVTSREILNGVDLYEFAPSLDVTRAMIVTVLGRLSDVDASIYSNSFSDVDSNSWYGDYVAWAKSNGIVNGVSPDKFSPDTNLTREQLAVIIDNYLTEIGSPVADKDVTFFVDNSEISSWANNSVYRLKSIGLVNGDPSGRFNPKDNLTRAELSAILQRLIEYTLTN